VHNLKILLDEISFHKAQKSISTKLFLALCLNLLIAPTVYAANSGSISRTSSYAIGLLLIVTVGLAIYLLVAMLQPQRF
jgi:K+-transporting ATPase KdpF subunit